MGNKIIAIIVAVFVLFGLGYYLGRRLTPPKEIVKLQEVEKVVYKENKDVVTVIKEVTRPDGTKEKTTQIVDKSVIASDTTIEKKYEKSIIPDKESRWLFSGGASAKIGDFNNIKYEAQVSRRIIGPFFGGVKADTAGNVGLLLTMEF